MTSTPLLPAECRRALLTLFEARRDTSGLYGAYRMSPRGRCDLYSSADAAITRTVMGEDLRATLSLAQREEWISHLHSFAQPNGLFQDNHGCSFYHALGTVVGALGVLGGGLPRPTPLFDELDNPEKIAHWLETRIDWSRTWPESHHFWGGMHVFSFSRRCTDAWRETVFAWLDAQADERTGFWRKGIAHADRHQGLGGFVHIVPMYEHHGRVFPYPERVIDSVLAMQTERGDWLVTPNRYQWEGLSYLDLDALYAYWLMGQWVPGYRRGEVAESVRRFGGYASGQFRAAGDWLRQTHPHNLLAAAGIWGLLTRLLPDEYPTDAVWSDIFSDRRLYLTHEVETPPTPWPTIIPSPLQRSAPP